MTFKTNLGGEIVDPVPRRLVARGRVLTEEEVRLWNDLLYRILTGPAELSPEDATRVLSRAVSDRQRQKRTRCLREAERAYRGLWGVMAELKRRAEVARYGGAA